MRASWSALVRFAVLFGTVVLFTSCTKGGTTADRVQPNLVDKGMFEGEWWVTQTVIGADADATGVTWNGDSGWDLSLDNGESGSLGRIRWVIDEEFLFAFRSYELVEGANPDGRDEGFRGEPLAAFPIIDHVDVRRQYNEVTGESTNVVEENTEDRRWFERQYMRVDWANNRVMSFFFPAELSALGGWTLEPGTFFIQDGSSHCRLAGDEEECSFPRAWEPQFVTVGQDPSYRFIDDWPEGSEDLTHYMSFVTFMSLSPGALCLTTSGAACQTLSVPARLAFLRVPPGHEYAASRQTHEEFDRMGVFRTYQRTYIRSSSDVNARRCDRNADCGTGGFCDASTHTCAGGLGDDFGETDALAFLRPRHNFFRRSFTEQSCRVDWECDGRFGGGSRVPGSVCDPRARRCTIPLPEREVRQLPDGSGAVAYYLNAGYPKHLVHPAMEVVGNWNEAFMRGWRAARGQALPDYGSVRIDCQNTDPTRYCFCGSLDESGGTCAGRYDPFVHPDWWVSRGVDAPYQCHVQNSEFEEPTAPTSYDAYVLPQAYRYEFVGDECLFVLRPNSCDRFRTDASQRCEDVLDEEGEPVAWEQLGDLRYQFFHYIDQVNTPFGGVAYPLADPTNGELITANANFSATGVESNVTRAVDFFPVLRCANESLGCDAGDQAAAERYLSGENLRSYFSNLGRTEHPAGLAASGSDGYTIGDPSRPQLPVDVSGALRETVARAQDRIDSLRGQEGRATILSDRLRRLAGTSIEQKLMSSMGVDGYEALHRNFDHGQDYVFGLTQQTSIEDESILDQISPFRNHGLARTLTAGADAIDELSRHNICSSNQVLFRRRYLEYWAEAFRDRPPEEASIRMQQLYTRKVQYHEIGHSVGLRHNFAASMDRDNYADGYFRAVFGGEGALDDLPLPSLEAFDLDGDGFLAGPEFDAYLARQREVRDERAKLGAHNYMSSSTMDYSGDESDAQGLGRYDIAAAIWNHFDQKEVYTASPAALESDEDGPFRGLKRTHEVPRVWWQYYPGGESCRGDVDCPYSRESGAVHDGQPVYQRCVQNPRQVFPQQECTGQTDCVCSSFDNDVQDFADTAGYPEAGVDRDFAPVEYLFCPDERTNDISWCTRFDAGESFREVIEHFRRTWEELYPSEYYRRYRRNGLRLGGAANMIVDAAKIYQHLFFRLNFEPAFSLNEGPLGFDDQFLASVDAMNWFIEILNLPDEGSYAYDALTDTYQRLGEGLDLPGSDFSLLPGEGFGMWTKYQEGYFGFFRPERIGVFSDKFIALQALAIRDWNLSFTIDERFFINFYDLFETEMTELFGGIILQDASWFAPRVRMEEGGPVIQHMSWYRGALLGECEDDGEVVPCRGSQRDVYGDAPALSGTTNEVIRSWAAVLALALFPVYYDTSFEQRLLIFKAGSGSGFTIPDIQPDGTPTCVYGSDGLGAGHIVVDPAVPNDCDSAEDADYVVFESNRFRTPYVAVKIRPNLDLNLEEEQIGFQLLKRLVDLQAELDTLPPSETSFAGKLDELQRGESFLEYLIELQTAYGISNFF